MDKAELVQYLANVILTCRADERIDPAEGQAMTIILHDLGASYDDFNDAEKTVDQGYNRVAPVGRFSDRLRNLEDMVFASLSDEELPAKEKKMVVDFAKQIGLEQKQLNEVLIEAKRRVKQLHRTLLCPGCASITPNNSRFCPHCGRRLEDLG